MSRNDDNTAAKSVAEAEDVVGKPAGALLETGQDEGASTEGTAMNRAREYHDGATVRPKRVGKETPEMPVNEGNCGLLDEADGIESLMDCCNCMILSMAELYCSCSRMAWRTEGLTGAV